MGDVGDFWKDVRDDRRRRRAHWHECPDCSVRYGTGTLVPPGCNCRNCDWRAPGQRGDDERAAKAQLDAEAKQAAADAVNKAARLKLRTCGCHGKVFKTITARQHHEANVHEAAARKRLERSR